MAQLDEPLVESAPLGHWVAARLCRTDPATDRSCALYHGLWQYLRLLGFATSPAHHAGFFLKALAPDAGAASHLRVLISGAMDYSMLAHVLWACGEHGVTPDVTIVDICDTPLFFNHWYARRAGTRVRTVRSDILEYGGEGDYDVICAHALLGQISPPRRLELMLKWWQLLRPGGRAVTVNRIRPRSDTGPVVTSPAQVQALVEAIRREAAIQRERLGGIEPEEFARGVEGDAMARRTYPISSRGEFVALFEGVGFAIEHISFEAMTAGNSAPQVSGPRIPGGSEYGHIVARRP